jgi:hypothetical protein
MQPRSHSTPPPADSTGTPSEIDDLQRIYQHELPGIFLREVFPRWPRVVAEVRWLREELRASRGQPSADTKAAPDADPRRT